MNKRISMYSYIKNIPKAEFHVHIEGTFEPELMFKIAKRNNIKLKYKSMTAIKKAYNSSNLQDFLNIYYEAAGVLKTEQDFYDLTWAYLNKAHSQNIVHTEIFFDPQTHTERGIDFSTVIKGMHRAIIDAEKKLGISSELIMCFLRHLNEESAMRTLKESLPYKRWITAVGLDSSEKRNPPSKFRDVFNRARKERFLAVAHAGEEGSSDYIWEAINILKVLRIDHGTHALNDKTLVRELVQRKIP